MNCVVPDWLLTDRAREELAAMTPAERETAPDPIPLGDLSDAVVRLIVDDAASGRVVTLPEVSPRREGRRGAPRRAVPDPRLAVVADHDAVGR